MLYASNLFWLNHSVFFFFPNVVLQWICHIESPGGVVTHGLCTNACVLPPGQSDIKEMTKWLFRSAMDDRPTENNIGLLDLLLNKLRRVQVAMYNANVRVFARDDSSLFLVANKS